MNTKILIYIVIAIVIIVGGFYLVNSYIYTEKQADFTPGETVVKEGKIISVNLEGVALDGPFLINIQGDKGELSTIAVPSFGLPLCEAYKNKNIADVNLLKNGDSVTVRGEIIEDGSIVPCESSDHYLRKK